MKNENINPHHLALEFDKILSNLSNYANSSLGQDACKNLQIFNKKTQIEYELALVDEAKKIIDDNGSSAPIDNLTSLNEIYKQNYFSAEEIIELAKNLRCTRIVKNYISKNEQAINLNEIIKNFYIDKTFEDEVFGIFDSELNIKDSASDTLKSLRNSYKDNKDNLKIAINQLLQNHSFVDNLQDTVVTIRDNRPVFQVKASCKNKIQGIVHDISSTNLTYFIEPSSLVPLSNKLRQIEIEIQAEIDRILMTLSNQFKSIQKELVHNESILVKLDVIFAKAKYSIHLHGVSAELTEDKIIDIQAMRHPLLIEVKKEEVVANDFVLGKDYNCLLITGSNTGGKTVALKTAGLMVLMTKAGMHIPCLGAKIYPYKNIFCDISSEQSLEQGFSTFSAHIKNISNIIDEINEKDLILFDELGSGTDPTEGSSLSRAILEFLKEKNVQGIITTHLGELKTLKYEDNYFENATVLFDLTTLKPKYNLIVGMSGTSNAIDISSQLGLNPDIIKRAREILIDGNNENSKMFLEIEKTNQSLIKKEQEASVHLESAKSTKIELDEKLKEVKQNKKKSLESFKKKFQNQLDSARDEIKEIVDEIRKEKSLKVAMRSYNRLNKLETAIREEFSANDDKLAEKFIELKPDELKIGQNVLVKKLEQVVILDSLPDKKGNVEIRIGNIKSKIHISKLAKTDKKVAPHLKKVQVSFDNTDNLLSRLDLRGMRALEAIEYLDEKLDKASLRGLNQITVIHGYGTGALKSAVNDYLKTSPYVAKFYYGDETQGRDGVVIIDLL
ncbi:MAG: Smr/MutS family protein [Candidatus Gastranaerophilales bacterium]|nr:Smr/MutS family protein [Candidatus Gastranaerophilales bacterium]